MLSYQTGLHLAFKGHRIQTRSPAWLVTSGVLCNCKARRQGMLRCHFVDQVFIQGKHVCHGHKTLVLGVGGDGHQPFNRDVRPPMSRLRTRRP